MTTTKKRSSSGRTKLTGLEASKRNVARAFHSQQAALEVFNEYNKTDDTSPEAFSLEARIRLNGSYLYLIFLCENTLLTLSKSRKAYSAQNALAAIEESNNARVELLRSLKLETASTPGTDEFLNVFVRDYFLSMTAEALAEAITLEVSQLPETMQKPWLVNCIDALSSYYDMLNELAEFAETVDDIKENLFRVIGELREIYKCIDAFIMESRDVHTFKEINEPVKTPGRPPRTKAFILARESSLLEQAYDEYLTELKKDPIEKVQDKFQIFNNYQNVVNTTVGRSKADSIEKAVGDLYRERGELQSIMSQPEPEYVHGRKPIPKATKIKVVKAKIKKIEAAINAEVEGSKKLPPAERIDFELRYAKVRRRVCRFALKREDLDADMSYKDAQNEKISDEMLDLYCQQEMLEAEIEDLTKKKQKL